MQGIISFSDRVAFNIKSNEHKDIILDQLKTLYNIKILQRHHHNLDNNNVNFILSNHLMNLRSNGNRYYLYFTLYNNIETIYFIDKSTKTPTFIYCTKYLDFINIVDYILTCIDYHLLGF